MRTGLSTPSDLTCFQFDSAALRLHLTERAPPYALIERDSHLLAGLHDCPFLLMRTGLSTPSDLTCFPFDSAALRLHLTERAPPYALIERDSHLQARLHDCPFLLMRTGLSTPSDLTCFPFDSTALRLHLTERAPPYV